MRCIQTFMIVSQLAIHVFYGILWETIHINSENEIICNGNTISQKAMEKIRVLKPNERFFISETMLGYSEYICIKRQLAPIEIIK